LFHLLLLGWRRFEVDDLIWGADEITTILGDASCDRIHIGTLIRIAKLLHDLGKSVSPTRFLLFSFPGSVVCSEISEELAICRLVRLSQLHETRRNWGWISDELRQRAKTRRSGQEINRQESCVALRTVNSCVVEVLVLAGCVLTCPIGQFVGTHNLCRIELVAVS
jgi:hypothetical protein